MCNTAFGTPVEPDVNWILVTSSTPEPEQSASSIGSVADRARSVCGFAVCGFAVCWYAVGGVPALVLFKVASTLDSMVGNRSPRYLRFGWAGARLDDVMNYVPARLTWLLLALTAVVIPGGSGLDALRVGWQQHAVLPGPNSGWSEAAAAGALRRRLVGPIWLRGTLVTETWIGRADDPPAATRADLVRALVLVGATGVLAAALAMAALAAA